MLTSSRSGMISAVGRTQRYYPTTQREVVSAPVQSEGNFDSITLSTTNNSESRFHKDLVGKISQEIRTTTTTSDIRALRQEVASGRYQPDASAIAARILFLGEDF